MANTVPISGEWTESPEIPVSRVIGKVATFQKKLNLVLPFIESDTPSVIRLLKWCSELSGKVPYTIFLLPFKGLNFTEVKMYAERAFTDVQVIQDGEGVTSDWKTDSKIRDAAGPNSMFRQAAWFFYFHQGLGSWLYLEPDCVPLKKDWIEQLEKDHFASGSLISGQKMSVGDKPYLNGVAIYPPNVINEAPEIVTQVMWQQHADMEIAFDIAGGDKVLQKAHLTDRIQLSYRTEGKPFLINEAVLFHGDRTGHLIESLRANNGKKGGDTDAKSKSFPAATTREAATASEINGAADTMSLGEQIRFHVEALAKLENGQPSRKQRIVDELRKRKLIPRARTQWKLPKR